MKPVDVRELLESPGSSRVVRVDEPIEGLKVGLAEIDSPVGAEVRLDSTAEGIWVSGTLEGRSDLTCARCLKSLESEFEVTVGELFTTEPDDEDDYAIQEPGEVDLEPMIRDAVLLSMPFSPSCKPDCQGLCPRCGVDRNVGECLCPEQDIDPRWAGLETGLETSVDN